MTGKNQISDLPPGGVQDRIRILQIFSRYKQYGGEEGSVYRISDILNRDCDTGIYLYSTADLFPGGLQNVMGIAKAFHNWDVVKQLCHYQELGKYDCWLIHNVFPAISPAAYEYAFELNIPIVHYLHNYRLGCVNGFFLNHGKPCQRCMFGNFLPALQTACWHDSHLQSGLMGAITARVRGMKIFKRVAHWIAISQAQKEEHVLMGIPESRISVIPHFLESEEEPLPYPERGDVLFVGRLSQEKGVDRLLRAWQRVQDLGRNLWIVGEGPERGALEKLTNSLSLRNVRFTGFLASADTKTIWERSACSVVPSIWKEPFGMVVLEAWARGRPVVAHRIGALPEIIKEDEEGILVHPDDPMEMAKAILSILQNPKKGELMGIKGLERLRKDFSQSVWQEKIHSVFRQIKKNQPSV